MFAAYGLTEKPFSLSPSPRYMYLAAQHRAAMGKILFTCQEREGLSLLIGDVGLGKTTIAHRVAELLRENPDNLVRFISSSYPTEHQLLRGICQEFDIPLERSKQGQLTAFNAFLVEQYQAGKNVILIIDEAQLCKGAHFELIRQMLNYEIPDQGKLIQIVLMAQEEIRTKLRTKNALVSRIATRATLAPLNLEDTQNLISFRLQVAGRDEPLFTPEAVDRIWAHSRGVPRTIMSLCLNMLIAAASTGLPMIDGAFAGAVIAESEIVSPPLRKVKRQLTLALEK
ncbi:MAG: AAA family ATPase [Candidatus Sericytochromatia bacterium]|nr:AAA family ATPase [Candidatus Sericytochromatia bacterium]